MSTAEWWDDARPEGDHGADWEVGDASLSAGQRSLWLAQKLEPRSGDYNLASVVRLADGVADETLRRAIREQFSVHGILRTTYHERNGLPYQRVRRSVEPDIGFLDCGTWDTRMFQEWCQRELGRPFDLTRSCARFFLLRNCPFRADASGDLLVIIVHHIAADIWSFGLFIDGLSRAYRSQEQPRSAATYIDFVREEQAALEGERGEELRRYWKEHLSGVPLSNELPLDRPVPAGRGRQSTVEIALSRELSEAVRAAGKRLSCTPFHLLFSALYACMHRWTGQTDIVLGTPVSIRAHQFKDVGGYFANWLPLRARFDGETRFSDLVSLVKRSVREGRRHAQLPLAEITGQQKHQGVLAPIFQVSFAWERIHARQISEDGSSLIREIVHLGQVGTETDLSIICVDDKSGLTVQWNHRADRLEAATVRRMAEHFGTLLERVTVVPDASVAALPMMSPADRAQVLETFNDTRADFPADRCAHELFEAQVRRSRDAVAVVHDGTAVTYGALNARANRLAHHLRALGVRPDDRVAICADRGPDMIAGLLAVLKAGGAYVPLDPAYPVVRLQYMLDDSAPAVLLTQSTLTGLFADVSGTMAVIDLGDPRVWAGQPETDPDRESVALAPEHIAYVIYTSGSTGMPKGVAGEHRGLVNRLHWIQQAFPCERDERHAQKTSLSFLDSLTETLTPLLAGAELVVVSRDVARDPHELSKFLKEERITRLTLVPSLLDALLRTGASYPALKLIVCSGETLTPPLVDATREALPATTLLNLYGSSEVTGDVTFHVCSERRKAGERIPIGRPIANTRIYILDAARNPVPVGVWGELYAGGIGVAREYLNRPELTAERFLADPFHRPGARMFRTGDVARWLSDGTIEYLGRNDSQVKVRGFRVELGEIEARLAEHPHVREAVVLAREDSPGDKRLVAYYTAGEAAAVEALRTHLAKSLPEYMVPAAYVWLGKLPLTPSGKVDRKALPAPEADAYAARGYEAPQGGAETTLAEIWADLLGVERVGRHDNFFELGGHSLLTVQVISRLRQTLGVEVAMGDLFARPVLADFARSLETVTQSDMPPLNRAGANERRALSFAQQRLWFLAQLEGASDAYHIGGGLRLHGKLDRATLRRALDRIVARHEVLRTTFPQVDGEPEQRIAAEEESCFHLVEHDLRGHAGARGELERLMAAEVGAPFDLEHGPLVRGRLVLQAEDEHTLLITMHHIVSDGWSMGVLIRELSALYLAYTHGKSDPLPELTVQYADYAAWQRRWVDGEIVRKQAQYWKETLAGVPDALDLPSDHARPPQQDYRGDVVDVVLDAKLTEGLRALGRRHGTTLFMTLLSGWAALLARLSGQEDLVVGTPTANRGHAETEGLIGFFVNTLALRLDLSGAPTVKDLLGRVKAQALAAQHHQDIPFEQVVEIARPARSLAHSPLFQVMLVWQSASLGSLELPGLELTPIELANRTSQFDLSLMLRERGDTIAGVLEYATALFDRATAERHLAQFRTVLAAMIAHDTHSIARLPLMSDDERRQVLVEWNRTDAPFPDDRCVHELIEAHARRAPDAAAVIGSGRTLTRGELDERADRIADLLRERGVRPDARVAISIERSPELIVAILATLKAGGAYVPIDPAQPADRQRAMLEDCAPVAVLTHGRSLESGGCPVIDLSDESTWRRRPAASVSPAAIGLTPAHLAYVMYTSGSTGRPKGVMIEHGGLCNQVTVLQRTYGLTPRDRVLQFAAVGFDMSVEEIFGALCSGAALVLRTDEWVTGGEAFWTSCERNGVTVANLPPLFWQQVASGATAIPRCIRQLMVGGDAVRSEAVEDWFARAGHRPRLFNAYGPTEATVNATIHELRSDDASRQSIGRPVANTRIYILDAHGETVPVGVRGEIHIAGVGVARGYWNDAQRTAEKFVANPYGAGRMYRTGDVGRWLSDGTIEFLGRNDSQVKVRGFRIEPGEIEARLSEHPGVREAVVLAHENGPGDKRLVAYYTSGSDAGADALRAHLTRSLPEYMVPAAYVRLERLPLTPNGKLNRKALPAPDGDAYAVRGYEAPQGDVETTLAAIWSNVLGVERVGRHDDFFELGGHSLLVVTLIERMRQQGLYADVRAMFVTPTLAGLAAAVADQANVVTIPANLIASAPHAAPEREPEITVRI